MKRGFRRKPPLASLFLSKKRSGGVPLSMFRPEVHSLPRQRHRSGLDPRVSRSDLYQKSWTTDPDFGSMTRNNSYRKTPSFEHCANCFPRLLALTEA